MNHKIRFRPAALTDLDETHDWYENQQAALGDAFMECLNDLIEDIASRPASFPTLEDDVKRGLTDRFPYCVYFTIDKQEIVVLAVLHGKRSPRVWQQRNE